MSDFLKDLTEAAKAKSGETNIKKIQEGRFDCFMVNPLAIVADQAFNIRDMDALETQQHVARICEDIMANGFDRRQPVGGWMRDGKLTLTSGFCRHAAVMLALSQGAEIASIPVIMAPPGTTEADLVASMATTDNSGLALNVLDLANGVKRLLAFGWNHDKIAARYKVTVPRVYQLISYLELPDAVKAEIRQGAISASMALQIVKEYGEAAVHQAVANARAEAETAPPNPTTGRKRQPRVRAKHLKAAARKASPSNGGKRQHFDLEAEIKATTSALFHRGRKSHTESHVTVIWRAEDYEKLTEKLDKILTVV